MIADANESPAISSPLEDYLETIYLLVEADGFARVKDIAKARNVKAATVSVALRKLAENGLIAYERREYIGLTPRGEQAARRILARHRLLTRFFEEILKMSPGAASEQACSLEHELTDEAMERMAGFFEFLGRCPSIVEIFARCPAGVKAEHHLTQSAPSHHCAACRAREAEENAMSLADMKLGQNARILCVTASGALRQRLLDMGLLPGAEVGVERRGPGGDPLWIRCQGARLALRRAEAGSIRVRGQI